MESHFDRARPRRGFRESRSCMRSLFIDVDTEATFFYKRRSWLRYMKVSRWRGLKIKFREYNDFYYCQVCICFYYLPFLSRMVHVRSHVANFALSIARLYSQTSSHFALLFVFRLGKISEQTERFIFKRHKYKDGREIVLLSNTEFEF